MLLVQFQQKLGEKHTMDHYSIHSIPFHTQLECMAQPSVMILLKGKKYLLQAMSLHVCVAFTFPFLSTLVTVTTQYFVYINSWSWWAHNKTHWQFCVRVGTVGKPGTPIIISKYHGGSSICFQSSVHFKLYLDSMHSFRQLLLQVSHCFLFCVHCLCIQFTQAVI